jgi:hypothetical protein
MSTKSREVIFGSRIRGAKIHAEGARERAKQAIREADRAEAEAWSIRMEGYGGPAQPSPTIAQCLNGATAGCRLDVDAAKRRPAFRSIAFTGRETRRSGNLKRR